MKRCDGRRADQVRPIQIQHDIYEYAAGSVLFQQGRTKILCAVTLHTSVPSFLRGKGIGWLTAEYALLPASTHVRTQRESSSLKRNNRSVEISRLIGRTLRTVVDCSVIGERTVQIDCDVLQADGGTRTASINAAYISLCMAQKAWLSQRIIERPFLSDSIAAVAVSVGHSGTLLLDPNFQEDSQGNADINVIMTHEGRIIELQGGAEQKPFSWDYMAEIGKLAYKGITDIAKYMHEGSTQQPDHSTQQKRSSALFSLHNRSKQFVSEVV